MFDLDDDEEYDFGVQVWFEWTGHEKWVGSFCFILMPQIQVQGALRPGCADVHPDRLAYNRI